MPARYLGNWNKKEVHDLTRQQANCQIREILPQHQAPFNTLDEAHRAGYDNCTYCIGGSRH